MLQHGVVFNPIRRMSDGAWVGRISSPASDGEILHQIRADDRILYAESDALATPAAATTGPLLLADDPLISNQWYLGSSDRYASAINLHDAWSITHGSTDTTVAVLDTGVRYEHPDIQGRLLPGYDFISAVPRANDGDARDTDASDTGNGVDEAFSREMAQQNITCPQKNSTWHGTAITSIIAANSDDEYGIAGVDKSVNVLPARVIGRCGGLRSDLLDAIRWAAGVDDPELPHNPTPAKIINISLAITEACSRADQSAIDDAVNAGAIVVAGVGNDQLNLDQFPTSPSTCNNVLAVAALKADGTLADYSNYGSMVDIAAPGGDTLASTEHAIITASNQGITDALPVSLHRHYSGTSVATPLVTGVLSLMLSLNPELSQTEIINILKRSTRPYNNDIHCESAKCGQGMLDAGLAVRNTLDYSNGSMAPELAYAVATTPADGTTNGSAVISASGTGTADRLLLLLLAAIVITRSVQSATFSLLTNQTVRFRK